MKFYPILILLLQGSLFGLPSVKPELVHPTDGSYLLIIQSLPDAGHAFGPNVYRARIETQKKKKEIIITSEGFDTPTELEFLDDSFFFTVKKRVKFEDDGEVGHFLIIENYSASIATYEFEGKKQYQGLQVTLYTPRRAFYGSSGDEREIYDPEVVEARFTLLEWPEHTKGQIKAE